MHEGKSAKPARIRFGDFELNVRSAELRAAGVLTKLSAAAGQGAGVAGRQFWRLVTRDQIRREVWGEETFIDFDQALNFYIRQIRFVLGDTAQVSLVRGDTSATRLSFFGACRD